MSDVTMLVTLNVSKERIADLLTCALEGGSGYWARVTDSKNPTDKSVIPENMDVDFLAAKPWGDGNLTIWDAEECQNNVLNEQKINLGLSLFAKKYPKHFGDFQNDEEDALTGDVFLQCCLFGEIVYG